MGGVQAMTAPSLPIAVVAGIGCRRNARVEDILAVLRDAEMRAGATAVALAAPDFKSGEAGLREAAVRLDVPLVFVGDANLAAMQEFCPTKSLVAARETGFASVAEASALAAAGPRATLVLARIAHPTATCALAVRAVAGP
jgi:cobalt-precorrin 5A hydrolase